MRVVAELPHPVCKITIFQMNQKYILKCEQGSLEQSYKISELDLAGGGVDEIFQLMDEPFMATVAERFKQMKNDFFETYKRHQ